MALLRARNETDTPKETAMLTKPNFKILPVDGPKPYFLLIYKGVDGRSHTYPAPFVDRKLAKRIGRDLQHAQEVK